MRLFVDDTELLNVLAVSVSINMNDITRVDVSFIAETDVTLAEALLNLLPDGESHE
jgi:hypothetical protein